MRYTARTAWVVLSRSSRVEWPLLQTVRRTRRGAREALWAELQGAGLPWDLIRQRWLDGSYRLARVTINLATPKEPTND